jgi:hypothetical protein
MNGKDKLITRGRKMKFTSLKLKSGYYVLRHNRYNVLGRKETYSAMLFETRKNALEVANCLKGMGILPNDLCIIKY